MKHHLKVKFWLNFLSHRIGLLDYQGILGGINIILQINLWQTAVLLHFKIAKINYVLKGFIRDKTKS